MVTRNFYKPRYKIAYQAKSKVWPYKNSRLRRFFNIRGRKLVRRGLFKRIVLVFNKMKWTIARRYIRPFMKKRRPISRKFKTAFYSKQQLRAFYGKEKEEVFRNFFKSFSGGVKNRGRIFITGIESRADVFLYRLRFLPTIYACRQFIHYFGLRINRGLQHAPSTRVLPGDIVSFKKEYWYIFRYSLEDRLYWRVFGLNIWKKRERKRLRKKLWSLKRNRALKKKNLAILAKRRHVFRQFMLTVALFHPFYTRFLGKLKAIYKESNVDVNILGLTKSAKLGSTYATNLQSLEFILGERAHLKTTFDEICLQTLEEQQGVPYFNVSKTLENLITNQGVVGNFDWVWNIRYTDKLTVLERVNEIHNYETSRSNYIILWTQFIKKKLINLWILFKLKLSKLLGKIKKRVRIRIKRKAMRVRVRRHLKVVARARATLKVWQRRPVILRSLRRQSKKGRRKTKTLYMRNFLNFINWIFKAYKFLYFYQTQFVELEYRYHVSLTWLYLKSIYDKHELLLNVLVNLIKQYEGKRETFLLKIIENSLNVKSQLEWIRKTNEIENTIKFLKLTAKEVLLKLLKIKDHFSNEVYYQKQRIFSKVEYKQALDAISVIREKLLVNRIKRFMRKPRIVKDRFTGKPKKLRAPVWKFRLKRRRKAMRRKNVSRFRKVHWYLPAYIYLDMRTLRAIYLYHPKPEEINFGFRCSLKGLQAFYSSAGY